MKSSVVKEFRETPGLEGLWGYVVLVGLLVPWVLVALGVALGILDALGL
jgi:hypothetical protein